MLGGCPSLAHLIEKTQQPIPRIVCVCDEYADLMLGSTAQRTAIETRISRLSGKARASGIHLILATQQPSRKTITGAIQTNLPGRVGLTMTSATESRMMFGEPGAENLLMKGDLLYKDIGQPKRYQAIYLGDHKLHEKPPVGNRDATAVSRT
jgi:DNA segregation ATPase FtsK/SpoIIIE-like protein